MNDETANNQIDPILAHLGEPLDFILSFDSWESGDDFGAALHKVEKQLTESVAQQERVSPFIRQQMFPKIRSRPGAPKGAGLYRAKPEQLEYVANHLLFNGATIAADGTVVTHDTLLMTIANVGVCLVNYQGDTREFRRQLFRRDLRLTDAGPIEEMAALLEERQNRAAIGYDDAADELSELLRRGLMSYGERGLLLEHCEGLWAMGHGSPVPRELLTGSLQPLLTRSIQMLSELVLQHRKFVYVPSSPRELLVQTLGEALQPLEFLIVDTLQPQMEKWVSRSNYSVTVGKQVREFVAEVGPKIVRGVYRASATAPSHIFYAHIDHAQEAALLAMADSILQEHRGFPLLLSIADTMCRLNFEPESYRALIQQSYAKAGYPFRFLPERETR